MNQPLKLLCCFVTCLLFSGQLVNADDAQHAKALSLANQGGRETVDCNADWRFKSFEIYNDAEASEPLRLGPRGLEATDYDDKQWRTVNIPHDWSIEGDYAPDHPTRDNAGYVQAGFGQYRKTLDVPTAWQGKRLWLEFDGVFRKSTVWVNGVKLGQRPYGWISFGYDITAAVAGKEKAVIAVRGSSPSAKFEVFYSIDGTRPTIQSASQRNMVHRPKRHSFPAVPAKATKAVGFAAQVMSNCPPKVRLPGLPRMTAVLLTMILSSATPQASHDRLQINNREQIALKENLDTISTVFHEDE